MSGILKDHISDDPKLGFNQAAHWGNVYLLREHRLRETATIETEEGVCLPMDGHVAFLHDEAAAGSECSAEYEQGDAQLNAVAIRCWGWMHGFDGDRAADMSQVMSAAYSNTAATIRI